MSTKNGLMDTFCHGEIKTFLENWVSKQIFWPHYAKTGTAQKHYQQKDELTACNFPYGTLFGWHPQVAGSSVENNIESLAWGSKVYGSVILSIKIILK